MTNHPGISLTLPQNEFVEPDHGSHPQGLTPDYNTGILRSPRVDVVVAKLSFEIIGPVFGAGPLEHDLILNYANTGEPPRFPTC
jgi:hypothetical protein